MKRMRSIAVIGSCATFAVAAAFAACSPFSGNDSSSPPDASGSEDGATSTGAADGAVEGAPPTQDLATCEGGIHVKETFDTLTALPPPGWTDGSYRGGTLSLEKTVKLGTASLKASVVDTDTRGVSAAIVFTVPVTITPTALRVQFAYRPVPATFTGDFYAELGCNVSLKDNSQEDGYVARNGDGSGAVGFHDTANTLPFSVVQDGWYHVTQELHLVAKSDASDVTLVSTLTPVDGGVTSKTATTSVAAPLGSYQILCGLPYATPGKTSMPTLDVYVDDVIIDVCP